MEVRHMLVDLDRSATGLREYAETTARARDLISELQNKLYERERYVEALEARLVELQTRRD